MIQYFPKTRSFSCLFFYPKPALKLPTLSIIWGAIHPISLKRNSWHGCIFSSIWFLWFLFGWIWSIMCHGHVVDSLFSFLHTLHLLLPAVIRIARSNQSLKISTPEIDLFMCSENERVFPHSLEAYMDLPWQILIYIFSCDVWLFVFYCREK